MPRKPKRKQPDRSPDAELGQRLRYVRGLFGYSQRELGTRAGLTHGTISFVERGKISPSVGTLRKILDSFPMTLSEFFLLDPSSEPQVFFTSADLLEVGGGGVSLRQVGRNLKGRPLQILHEHYQPGAETAAEPYSHEGEEGGIVLEGRIELTVGNQTRVLGPGESYLFPSRVPHRFRNPGPDKCVIISANSPAV
jgi:transcriptional regulator with XRE-family HTH domain